MFKKEKQISLKGFVRKNLVVYLIPNIIFNFCIPYFSFKKIDAIYLFQGEQCFARFLLPMALFLPFIITFDILNKTSDLSTKGILNIQLPDDYKKKRFIFKLSTIHGASAFGFILLIMLAFHFGMPADYRYNGLLLSILLGLLAGTLSVLFTFLSLKKIGILKFQVRDGLIL